MILKKEFYFIRHGQTEHNISTCNLKGDHPVHTPLNDTGRSQAQWIAPTIATLPIQTICASPLVRVQETKQIITAEIQVPHHHDIEDLSECSARVWGEMADHGMYNPPPQTGVAREFMDRVRNGINLSLSFPGPSLIVAHGGVHWALCCLMGIENHGWRIDHCIPVHFFIAQDGKWTAKKLVEAEKS